MYFEQCQKASSVLLLEGIEIANDCDLKYKTSRNQRLLVELCLMQLASLTAKGEKKNASLNEERFVLPPSYFKNVVSSIPKAIDLPIIDQDTPTPTPETIVEQTVVKTSETLEEVKQSTTPIEKDTPAVSAPSETEEMPMQAALMIERPTKKVSALSLKSIRKKQEINQEKAAQLPDVKNLPKEEFTEEAMIAAWNEYTQQIEELGKFNLLSHLTMGVPKLEGKLIHLEFPNETIKVEVERAKYELLGFLRDKLKNYDVDLSIEVNETAVKRYAYTSKEKFEKLKEKNPLMEQLRNEFDLDL